MSSSSWNSVRRMDISWILHRQLGWLCFPQARYLCSWMPEAPPASPGFQTTTAAVTVQYSILECGQKATEWTGTPEKQGGEISPPPPNLVSGWDFSSQSLQDCISEPAENVQFSFTPASQRCSGSYPKRGRMPSSRPAAAALRRKRGRQYIFLLRFCSGRCAPRGPASRRNSRLGWRAVN